MAIAAEPGRRLAASVLARALGRSLTDRALGRDRLTVLAYHRIADPEDLGDLHPGVVSATPAMFARQMDWVAREFSVIALDDLLAHAAGERPLPERPLLITFDDGYRDNHDVALPVLRARGLPAVLFLVTGAIGTDRVMWWDEVTRLVLRSPRASAELPPLGRRDLDGRPARLALARELLGRLKELADDRRAEAVEHLRAALEAPLPPPGPPLFMDWDEVRAMVAGGVDCQPHTHDHPLLTRVDPGRARAEVRRSADLVAERTGRPAVAFAYPNGSHDAAAARIVGEEGIRLAFTMDPGPARMPDALRAPLAIPRIGLDASDTFDAFRLKVSGGLAAARGALAALRVRGRS